MKKLVVVFIIATTIPVLWLLFHLSAPVCLTWGRVRQWLDRALLGPLHGPHEATCGVFALGQRSLALEAERLLDGYRSRCVSLTVRPRSICRRAW